MSDADAPRWTAWERLALAGVCLVVVVVYGSLLTAPPLTWDDGVNIFENPYLRQGAWTTLWSRPYFGMYIPVVSTLWAGLFRLGDGAAWPFRALNVALHLANVALLAGLLAGLLRRFELRANVAVLLGTALFALHPQQTAAVSWISGARDLASTTCALAAVGVYFGASRRRVLWSTLLFAAGLLCKPQIAGVPLAVVAFVWAFDRARLRATLVAMSGWAAMVVASAIVTSRSQAQMLSVHVPWAQRPVVALDALGFYLLKTIWPYPLAADYGRTPSALWNAPSHLVPTLVACVVGLGALWWAVRRDRRFLIAVAWVLVLSPVLGLVTFAYQRISTVADHYDYLPLAVVAAVVAVAAARAVTHAPRRATRVAWVALALVAAVGGAASWVRAQDWRGDDRFFGDMLAKNPGSFSAKIDLSAILCDRGDWQAGLALVEGAAALAPTDPAFLANRAYCLYRAGRHDDVLAMQQRLRDAEVGENLARNEPAATILASSIAGSFVALDRPLQAFAYLCQAQALAPQDADIATNIASVTETLRERGRDVRCPGRLPWDVLERVVAELR